MSFADLVTAADRAAQDILGGTAAIYRPEFGAEVAVTGMFDENYLLTARDGSGVENIGPALFVKLADLPASFAEDEPRLEIGGTEYTVHGRETDGSQGGGVLLLLHRVP